MILLTDELLTRLSRGLAARCLQWFVREDMDFDDVAQQAALGIWARGPYEHVGYAWRAGRNALVDHVRVVSKKGKAPARILPGGSERAHACFGGIYRDPEPHFIQQEHAAWLLRRLDERTLEILDRSAAGQFDREIAAEMKISTQTIWATRIRLPLEIISWEDYATLRGRSLWRPKPMKPSRTALNDLAPGRLKVLESWQTA